MKKPKALFAFFLSYPFSGIAQEKAGTFIDLTVQDSSYMEQDLLEGVEQSSSSSSNITIYIVIAVIIIAIAIFVIIKRNKKRERLMR